MARPKTSVAFLETEEGQQTQVQLREMNLSETYNTEPSYSPNKALYPDNLIPFEDKHINYLVQYPTLDAGKYIANLKLRLRPRLH